MNDTSSTTTTKILRKTMRKRRDTVLTRIDKNLRDKMRKVARENGTTMSIANDKALIEFLESQLKKTENV
ncbi:MAG: hypothetical protein Q8R36_05365 [bacterium]|nr:hypothetical protein [bacterium]